MDTGGRICGAKRRQRSNFGPPWKESHRNIRGGGKRERESHSRIHREVVIQRGELELWDGDGRISGGRMTSCGRRRCCYGDG